MARKIKPKKNPAPWEMRNETVRPGGQHPVSRMIVALLALTVLVICIVAAVKTTGATKTATTSTETDTVTETETPVEETTPVTDVGCYYAVIDVQDYGQITVYLDGSAAPITVQNFVDLANRGFYDGLTFHRIMEGFMMQGGASSTEIPPSIKGEFSLNGYDNPISHVRGVISMARGSAYDSGTSQFFIMHKDNTSLDGVYAAFGWVTEGIEVVDAICENSHPTDNNGTIPLEEQPVINSITVTEAEPAQG